MNDVIELLSKLSPEKRALVELQLKKKGSSYNTFPLSYAQQRLWFFNQLEPESYIYNIPLVLRLKGKLNKPILDNTISELIRRHEILRTALINLNDKPYQVISKPIDFSLPLVDLVNLATGEKKNIVKLLALNNWKKPFDLKKPPLFRAMLLRISESEHVLIFILHHIISDGWSNGIIIKEVSEIYKAFISGHISPLQELEYQYVDFTNWQREWFKGEKFKEQLDYWKKQLTGAPPIIHLPIDRPRPSFQNNQGAHKYFTIPAGVSQALSDLSRTAGTTLFMTLLASFKVLLYRYSSQQDICVGIPIANRTNKHFENLIGFFVNTLVLRTDLANNPKFLTLLKRVKNVTLEAYTYQDLPFEKLVEELHPDRNTSHTPLFQVMFVHQNKSNQSFQLPGLSLDILDLRSDVSAFDLTLAVTESENELRGSFEYSSVLFDHDTIDRMILHFQQVLKEISQNPEILIDEISLITPEERQKVLYGWNNTDKNYTKLECIHTLIEQKCEETPGAIAVISGGSSISYSELNSQANRLSHYLIRCGAKPEMVIGINVKRSINMIIGLLAILKSGCGYLPLDPAYPKNRLNFMLDEADVKILLTEEEQLNHLSRTHVRMIYLDRDHKKLFRENSSNPVLKVDPQNLAYIIFTSGSTGVPKGVLLPHYSVVNHNLATIEDYQLTPEDRLLQFSSLNFDTAVEEIFPTLMCGATLILRNNEPVLTIQDLIKLIQEEKITFLDLPTAYWHEMVFELSSKKIDLPESIRYIIVGGEEASVERFRTFYKNLGGKVQWANGYGPTETSIVSTAFILSREKIEPEKMSRIPIGRPIRNLKNYVLDKNLNPVPVGLPGELFIGGKGVSRGYLNRPEITADKFLPNPYCSRPGERMYRTGDIARFQKNGRIEYLGRIDSQVKIRGFRIELGEIEAALKQDPNIKDSVVEAKENAPGNKLLVGYLVLANEHEPNLNDLRNELKAKLPDYMIPSTFMFIDDVPLTPNGKIDRRSLPEPDWESIDSDEFVPLKTQTEELLANIFSDVLGKRKISSVDNFFAIGGHSLKATQVFSRIREVFNLELPLRELFEYPVLADLAKRIEYFQRVENGLLMTPIDRIPRNGNLPLSFAQQRLWFLDQLEPDSPVYNIPESFRLHGKLNIDKFIKSLEEVVHRHENLRTTFHTESGNPSIRIHAKINIPFSFKDFSALSHKEKEKKVQYYASVEAKKPISLSEPPLFNILLLKLNKEEHVILFTIHHIISDNWSLGIFIQELAVIYDSLTKNKPSPLPELAIQYVDFAQWQRHWLKGEVLQKQLDYWKKKLDGIPQLLPLPTDRPRPVKQTYKGSYSSFAFSEDFSNEMRSFCQQEGVTPFMMFLAVFKILLSRYSGENDLCVGIPIANRNRLETERLIGFFVNTLVLRTDLSGDPNFRHVLHQVKETALEAFAHQDLPFENLVDTVQPERDLKHSPLFQVMFSMQNSLDQRETISSELSIEPVEAHSGTAKFDLTLFMSGEGDCFRGALEYNTDLFDEDTIIRMLHHYKLLLEKLVSKPVLPISTVSLMDTEEQLKIISEFNKTKELELIPGLLHQVFEGQVIKRPNEIALLFGNSETTYDELNRRANQVAHVLRECGVGPDVLVGISIKRSPELIVGLLGILKAGGAYLPIDVNYPLDRLNFMLLDSGVKIVLTSSDLLQNEQIEFKKTKRLNIDSEEIRKAGEENLPNIVDERNLAYVIYTSGSSGKPKGTLITHQGLRNYLSWCVFAYPVTSGRGSIVHSTVSFDATVTALFPALLCGKSTILLPETLDLEVLSRSLEQYQNFSLVKITPAHLELLSHQLSPSNLNHLTKSLVIGGENLTAGQIGFWQENAPGTLLFNEYGPTETVVGCVVFEASKWRGSGTVPIGKVIPNMSVYVLDAQLQPVPVGFPGKLYIGGVGVARGYLNRPALTAEKFIPDVFNKKPGSRLYDTGDLVRFLKDGNLEFLGRMDAQVKIRGFRIELKEIEYVIRQFKTVRHAVALVIKEHQNVQRLVAYCVNKKNQSFDLEKLQKFLRQKLPVYMIPSKIVLIKELPLTLNGKIDYRALRQIGSTQSEFDDSYIEPRNEIEKVLADIWQQLLSVEKVGVKHNFFELGGDSILTIQMIARAKDRGLQFTPVQVFQNQTIEELAQVAREVQLIDAEQGAVTGDIPLTPIQHWFFNSQLSDKHHYNQSMFFSVKEKLDPEKLKNAVEAVLDHHDALRIKVVYEGPDLHLFNPESVEKLPFNYFDLSSEPDEKQREIIERKCEELQSSHDLSLGPLMQVAYFDFGEKPGRLFISIHHLSVDGVSWRILLEDFQNAYVQISQNADLQLPAKTTSFKSWSENLVEFAQSELLKKEIPYWSSIAQKSVKKINVDFPDGRNEEKYAKDISISLPEDLTNELLQKVPGVYHTQINDILLTALVKSYEQWTGNRSLLISMEGHGREHIVGGIDISRTVGWFTSIFPVYLDLKNVVHVGELIKSIKEQIRQIPNNGIGFGVLRYLSPDEEVRNRLSKLEATDISFNYLGQFDGIKQAASLFGDAFENKGPDRSLNQQRSNIIEITGGISNKCLVITFTFSTDILKTESVQQFANSYLSELKAIINHCKSPEAGGYTASDFKMAKLSQDKLNNVLAQLKK